MVATRDSSLVIGTGIHRSGGNFLLSWHPCSLGKFEHFVFPRQGRGGVRALDVSPRRPRATLGPLVPVD
jgi:hypothetical protein